MPVTGVFASTFSILTWKVSAASRVTPSSSSLSVRGTGEPDSASSSSVSIRFLGDVCYDYLTETLTVSGSSGASKNFSKI